jgi:hypothetical protein
MTLGGIIQIITLLQTQIPSKPGPAYGLFQGFAEGSAEGSEDMNVDENPGPLPVAPPQPSLSKWRQNQMRG